VVRSPYLNSSQPSTLTILGLDEARRSVSPALLDLKVEAVFTELMVVFVFVVVVERIDPEVISPDKFKCSNIFNSAGVKFLLFQLSLLFAAGVGEVDTGEVESLGTTETDSRLLPLMDLGEEGEEEDKAEEGEGNEENIGE